MPLIEELRCISSQWPDRIALRTTWQSLSYRTLMDRVCALADELLALDVGTVAMQVDNRPEWVMVDLACQHAGLCLIPLPAYFSGAQCRHALRDSGAGVLIVDASVSDAPAPALAVNDAKNDRQLESLPALSLKPLLTSVGQKPKAPPATVKITYTSGSTSAPKGVCLSSANQLATALAVNGALSGLNLRCHLAILPLATLLENVAGVYAALLRGATVCLPSLDELGWRGSSGIDLRRLTEAFDRYQPTSAIILPQLLKGLLARVDAGWLPPTSLKFLAVGGARVAAGQIVQARQAGLPVYEGYGLSECASVVSLNTPSHDRPGTAGMPLSHVVCNVVDGELHISGNTFLGYLGQTPDDNAVVATGDLARFDDQGFVQLGGRSKNLLVSSFGRNISPEWLESELLAMPDIAQCIVIGDDRPYCSALILPAPGVDAAAIDSAVSILNAAVPDYARILAWRTLPAPLSASAGLLTANGRLRRQDIQHYYGELISACYAGSQDMVN